MPHCYTHDVDYIPLCGCPQCNIEKERKKRHQELLDQNRRTEFDQRMQRDKLLELEREAEDKRRRDENPQDSGRWARYAQEEKEARKPLLDAFRRRIEAQRKKS